MDLSEDKKSWIEKYAKMHELNENSLGTDEIDVDPETDRFPSILPLAMKLGATTIGQVSVSPMEFETDEDRIKRETKIRKDKIDALIEGVEFELTEEHEPKFNSPKNDLFYLDYKFPGDETEDDK